jgi:glycine/D-amino acid oxidase-like deaminating enzyme
VKSRVAVLGAGIQGTCVAFELAARGHSVDLYDRNGACVTQASAQNEGKIHLGFVYANDRSRRTARMMLRGALSFAPLMRRWLGGDFDRIPLSSPFYYAVNAKSLLTVAAIQSHFDDCVNIASELGSPVGDEYFHRDYREPVRRLSAADVETTFDSRNVKAVFQTNEIAVDPEALARVIRQAIASVPEISLRLETTVQGVAMTGKEMTVTYETGGLLGRESYDHVVNALWDGRLAIDASLGQVPRRPWLWRLRRNVRVESPLADWAIPSTTNVLGPFGDIVNFGNGVFYLSWYPSGRIGLSREIAPLNWEAGHRAADAPATQAGIVAGLSTIMPAVGALANATDTCLRLTSGIVFAWGSTDINDPESTLHQRYEVGVHSDGRYHSIDTGKYCLAPSFATEVADRITAQGDSR